MMPVLWAKYKEFFVMVRKPKGFGKFSKLLRRLAAVPKEVVEQKIAQAKAARKLRLKK
jgi:hypothetical protein